MIAGLIKKITSNTSFLILGLGAGSNFVLTLLSKNYFSSEVFNSYSLFLTFIGIISSFGLIGFDQLFLRLSVIEGNKIVIKNDLFFFLMLSLILTPFFFAYYFFTKDSNLPFFHLLICGIGINIIILTYNLLRLKQAYVASQVFKNGFKIGTTLIAGIVIYVLGRQINLLFLIELFSALIVLLAVFGSVILIKYAKKLKIKTQNLGALFLSFGLNLALLTLLGYGERFLIIENLSKDDFGTYFYYSTIFLFPLTLIQQYVGFKELVVFKSCVDKTIVLKKVKYLMSYGVLLLLVIYAVAFLDNGYFLKVNFDLDLTLILLMSILGLVKLIYGLFSAILGAVGESKELFKVNLLTVILIVLSLLFMFSIGVDLLIIVSSLILIFLTRSLFVYKRYVLDKI